MTWTTTMASLRSTATISSSMPLMLLCSVNRRRTDRLGPRSIDQLLDRDRVAAVWAGCSGAHPPAEDTTVLAALLAELAFPALAALVDAAGSPPRWLCWSLLPVSVGLLSTGGRTEAAPSDPWSRDTAGGAGERSGSAAVITRIVTDGVDVVHPAASVVLARALASRRR